MSEQWYDSEYQWVDSPESEWFLDAGVGYSGLYQVWTDDDYVYAATTSGLYIIDGYTEQQVAYVKPETGSTDYRTVFADGTYVYIGTAIAGVKRLSITDIETGGNLITSLIDYVKTPDITSNDIRYIHGNDNNLILCTSEGVDIVYKSSFYVANITVSGTPNKCFALNNSYYYTVSGTNSWTLNRIEVNNFVPNKIYTTGVGFLSNATRIKDFYVTENTSTVGDYNTIFIATDAGVSVFDEGSENYIEFTTGL
jgi:hypothetical protein